MNNYITKAGISTVSAVFLLFTLFSIKGHSGEMATVTDLPLSFNIESGIEYLIEKPFEKLTYEQVLSPEYSDRWNKYKKKRINFSYEPRPVWLRFTIENRSLSERDWLLGIDWPLLECIDFYQITDKKDPGVIYYNSGMEAWSGYKMYMDPGFMFPLQLEKGKKSRILLRVSTEATFIVPLTVWEQGEFQRQRYEHGIFMGFLFGVLLVMMLYNLSLWIFTRERSYFFYSTYLASIILYELSATGYGVLYLWGESSWLRVRSYEFFASMSFLAATIFFRYFLDLKNSKTHLNRINQFLIFSWTIIMIVSTFHFSKLLSAGIVLYGFLGSFAGIYISIVLMLRGNFFAKYFLAAWSIVIAGTSALLLSVAGVIEANWFTENGQHIAFMIETVLLSIALADRIRIEKEKRELAQNEAIELAEKVNIERREKIEAQERAIAIQKMANADLDLRVQERTFELNIALKNLEIANGELALLSHTDSLTKLSNRRYFDLNIRKEYERSVKNGEPLALIMMDIDHFKVINDRYGHLEGDRCLKLVAEVLITIANRTTDMVARYGGEEFALLLPNTGLKQAMLIAERARSEVEKINFVHRGMNISVTISLGVVSRITSLEKPIEDFIADADLALYKAKISGRNRVMPAVSL